MDELTLLRAENQMLTALLRSRRAELRAAIEQSAAARLARCRSSALPTWDDAIQRDGAGLQLSSSMP